MKTCVVRRRFWAAEATNRQVRIDLEPGFGVPKACLIFYVEANAATDAFDTSLAHRNLGVGIIAPLGDGTTALTYRCVWITQQDNVATAAVARQNSSSRFITYYQATSATFTTDTANFSFGNFTPQTNGHIEAICIFFGGDDITVGGDSHAMPSTSGGTTSYTSLNFQPDVIIAASTITALDAGLTDDARFCFGAATRSPAVQKSIYWHNEAASTKDLGAISSSDTLFKYATSNGVGPYNMTISNITTGGFTITSDASAAGSNNNMIFLAIKGFSPTHFSLVDLVTATATGNQYTSTGFVPKTIIGAATNATTNNTRITTSPGADSIQLFAGNRTADTLYFDGVGSITSSTASATVTGTGTSFYRFAPGFKLYANDNTLVGTVSTVGSQTSITLTGSATTTLNTAPFCYSSQGQYCISYGDQDANTGNTVVFSQMSASLVTLARSSAGSPVDLEVASLTNFDTRPGFNLNFTTASGTARRGWVLAFENTDNANEARRRTDAHY
jgi:hypothetical protein